MNNFLEELKCYFATTPKEKIMEDWNKSVEFNKVGITIDEFLKNSNLKHKKMEQIEYLIGTYENRVKVLKDLIEKDDSERLKVKLGCYRSFLNDLKNARKSASMF
jgi:hypothetical protein